MSVSALLFRFLVTSRLICVFVSERISESTACEASETDGVLLFFPKLYLEIKLFFPNQSLSISSIQEETCSGMLLLVKSENKSCLQAEQRDDYQADTVWATCQHYTVKKPILH